MRDGIGRILLAEDNIHDVELTREALAGNNLANEVDVVRDGQEALDYLYRAGAFASRETGDPIVILLDLKMPKVDGLEVLRRVKEDSALRHIPIVMLTARAELGDIAATLDQSQFSGGIVLAYGWALVVRGWLTLVYATVLFVFLDIKSECEERWLIDKFPDYSDYQRRVRKLIPFIY